MDNKNNTLPSKDLIVNVLLGIIIILAFCLPEGKNDIYLFVKKSMLVSLSTVLVLQHKEKITLKTSRIVVSILIVAFLISVVYFVFLQK